MRVLLFGGSGLLGTELTAHLAERRIEFLAPSRAQVDCRDFQQVSRSIDSFRPSAVIVAAARVGGIAANLRHGAEYLFDNAMINLITLRACAEAGVPQAMVFGGSCLYPCGLERPIREDDFLQGPLEKTSEGYAIGKIAGAKYAEFLNRLGRCRAILCVPTSLYGDRDRFDAQEGHLVSSLIVKMHQAKEEGRGEVELWGDGSPRRDFLHASDAARACLAILEAPEVPWMINVGTGEDLTVREIAEKVAQAVGFRGRIRFGGQFPNGTRRKLLNNDRIRALGWEPRVPLEEGLRRTYRSFLTQREAEAVTK